MNLSDTILVFISSFMINVFYARYVKTLQTDSRFWAANYGELTRIAGAIVTIAFVHNPWYLIPTVAGGWLGTYYYR